MSNLVRGCLTFLQIPLCTPRIIHFGLSDKVNSYIRRSQSTQSSTIFPLDENISQENDHVSPKFTNRNPRNLELMNVARKRKGWKAQYPPVEYYHRLLFETTNRHTTGQVEHCSGIVVISASTKEYCIAKHLYSLTDNMAALNIGRVLALRCLQSGISNMIAQPPLSGDHSHKFLLFQQAVVDGGVDLFEGNEIVPDYEPGIDYDDEEVLKELYRRQAMVANLSETHAKIKELRSKRKRAGSNWSVPPNPVPLTEEK